MEHIFEYKGRYVKLEETNNALVGRWHVGIYPNEMCWPQDVLKYFVVLGDQDYAEAQACKWIDKEASADRSNPYDAGLSGLREVTRRVKEAEEAKKAKLMPLHDWLSVD